MSYGLCESLVIISTDHNCFYKISSGKLGSYRLELVNFASFHIETCSDVSYAKFMYVCLLCEALQSTTKRMAREDNAAPLLLLIK